jgi:hypothetical protein
MKKGIIALVILLLCALVYQANAATWYAGSGDTDFNAVSGGTTSSVWNSNADGTSGTYLDFATQPSNGDIFVANGATIAIDDNIGSESVTVTLTTAGNGGTDGGGFTVNISAVGALVLYTNLTAGTTDCLAITGAGSSGTELTINGNITGGSAANADGVADSHTGVGAAVVVNGTITGGSAASTTGYNSIGATGTVTITGNVAAGSGTSTYYGFYSSSGTITTITGNCTGAGGANAMSGCHAAGAGGITVIGNIINTARAVGASGCIKWTPTAPSSGVNGHYVKFDGGGTAVYVGKNTETQAKAMTDFYYFTAASATSTVGTATGSGGGASGW